MYNTYLLIQSPMEQFEIYPLISLGLIINNVIFYFLMGAFLSIFICFVGLYGKKVLPNAYGITHESLYRTLLLMVDNFIGRSKLIYLPMIYTIFHLILFCNLLGMVPYSTTSTVEIVMTLSLSFTFLIGVLILGFISHKLYLLAVFLPAGTPLFLIPAMIVLEILAYLTRTLSLGLRLAVNMITGHILVKVCIGLIWVAYLNGTSLLFLSLPLFLLTLFLALELLIAYLQAYIFTFITCISFKDMA